MQTTTHTPTPAPVPTAAPAPDDLGRFEPTDEVMLRRFLIMGAQGPTCAVGSKLPPAVYALAPKPLLRAYAANPKKTIDEIVTISTTGRALKNDFAIYALAACCKTGPQEARALAYKAMPQVCRTGTHLFLWAHLVKQFGGWSKGVARAVTRWYRTMEPRRLALQTVKYQGRSFKDNEGNDNRWTHGDLLALSHLRPSRRPTMAAIEAYARGTMPDAPMLETAELFPIAGAEALKTATTELDALRLIKEYDPPHECIPTQWLKSRAVWELLLQQQMPMTALLRSLGRATATKALQPDSALTAEVVKQLVNVEALKRARVHPMQALIARKVYMHGRGLKGNLTWTPVPEIVSALESVFYASFGTVEPTGKRLLISVDVSGSMDWTMPTLPLLNCREAAAVMAMVAARTEPHTALIRAFDHTYQDPGVRVTDSLDEVVKKFRSLRFGATDCALPMLWAAQQEADVDCFITLTDNETWYGKVHPHEALTAYRRARVPNAASIVMAMTYSKQSIADPSDARSLDIVGFDAAAPLIVNEFLRDG